MIARLQQAITLTMAALVVGWAAVCIFGGRGTWAFGGLALLAGGYALVIGAEFVLLAQVHRRDDPTPRAGAAQLLRAWLGEVRTAPRVFCWRQPFFSSAEPDHVDGSATGRRGIVFIHGFFCNRALWNPWMARLRRRGVPFVAVNLEPVLGPIDAYRDIVDAAVRRIEHATGVAPLLVAHSMGGLAARDWWSAQTDPYRVHRIVTIGSPHHGTWLAGVSRARNGRQMRLGSDWLVALARREAERAHPYRRYTCFYGNCDNIVFPPSVATLPGADNRLLTTVAHVHMVYAQAVADEVDRWLAAPIDVPAAEIKPPSV
ncbi:MAG: alpha/beta fold hydrolase [Proteobacteria bacterium]|nr:alpha/beta fold hydrolase [Pseudomonadota bacterium]